MAATDNEVPAPIIIKKVIKGGGGHHGGAWKVAYADFVTAMMAFFLLMWLLNVTTKEERNAISNYFDPTHPKVSSELSGSGGILGGMTISPQGAQTSTVQDLAAPQQPMTPKTGAALGDKRDQLGTSEFEGDTFDPTMEGNDPSDTNKTSATETDANNLQDGLNILDVMNNIEQADLEQLQAIIDNVQNDDFEAIKQQILEEVSKSPELIDLMDQLMIDITPEGLRIQIIDKEGRSMFPIGRADMYDFMRALVTKVTQIIIPQPNQISVRGHTDGKPYPEGATYNNWNLSSDRAIASQRAMLDAGLSVSRVENVVGKADRDHLFPDDPLSPRNRRISVILLREKLENADEIRQKAAQAIERAAKKIEESKPLQDDRRDIPELDRVDDRSLPITIENEKAESEVEAETGNVVGNEIKKLREQQEQNTAQPHSVTAPRPAAQQLEF